MANVELGIVNLWPSSGNNIGSGNSGLKVGRNDDKESLGDWISGLVGCKFFAFPSYSQTSSYPSHF
tara:strand:+ start:88 stop:285 length:198 start_codon:yes stop_codon:yes gene_type:complete